MQETVSESGLHKLIETQLSGKTSKLKRRRDKAGNIVPRPPLSRSTTVGDLGDIKFVGPNFSKADAERKKNFKNGLRLSTCYDNVTCYGAEFWTTTNGEFGSVVDPKVLKVKRHGLTSFELLRYLPNHPHWKDRPFKPNEPDCHIPTPKSTYSDLGSFYTRNNRLPMEYTFTKMFAKKEKKNIHDVTGGEMVM
jgi:hypothetical protein